MRYTDQEIETFKNRTNQELLVQDPETVLKDLGIEYKELGNDSYRMNIRNEKTASAYITLKNGEWKYKDFGGAGSNGSIVNVVMDVTNKNYKNSLNYSLQTLGLKNHLQEALNSKQEGYELSKADRERIKQQREANQQKEKSHSISRVTGTYEVSTNQLAIDYLKARGIEKIPPQMKIISGEYENKTGDLKKVFGVGIKTQGEGADIHFLKKIGDLKTFQIGEKDISFFKNPSSTKVAVMESKMDYAAAYQQMPLDNVNVIIANSTSNARKVSELLKKENLNKQVMMFNQNDLAGYKFTAEVAKNAEINEFKCISYDVMGEYKKDINDLLLDDEKIADRIETQSVEYFQKMAESLESIQQLQQQKTIDKKDLQIAEQGFQKEKNQSAEQVR